MHTDSISIYKKGSDFLPCISSDTIVIAENDIGITYPIAYIHKPKGISIEKWNEVKAKLVINILK